VLDNNITGIFKLSLAFGKQQLFHNADLSIRQGEKVCITGPSGSGKTTFLNLLMGFQQASEGEVRILGTLLREDNVKEVRAKMAWLPQEISVDAETGRELLMLPFSFRQNRKHKPEEDRIASLLTSLNLETDLLEQKTDTLSGGQKQRLALASCLLLQKPLLLLDEPSSALDDASVDAVADALEALPDTTLITVSHDERWFRRMERIIKIEQIQGTDGHNL